MMRAFNATQVVALFAAAPYGIAWLSHYSVVASIFAAAAYVAAFVFMVAFVCYAWEHWK